MFKQSIGLKCSLCSCLMADFFSMDTHSLLLSATDVHVRPTILGACSECD